MSYSTRTPEDEPIRCPICGHLFAVAPSAPPGDVPCPNCGSLVWFPRAQDVDWIGGFPVYVAESGEADTKEGVIRTLVGRLIEDGHLRAKDYGSIVSGILKREFLGSTGVGGIAIPHTIHPNVERVVGAVAKLPDGVDFDSLDGQPVYLVCLLISPVDRPGDYMRALEAVAKSLRQ